MLQKHFTEEKEEKRREEKRREEKRREEKRREEKRREEKREHSTEEHTKLITNKRRPLEGSAALAAEQPLKDIKPLFKQA